MSISEHTTQKTGTLTIEQELILAYLLPSYETNTRKIIKAQENFAILLRYIEEEMDIIILNQLLARQLEEISELEAIIEEQENELREQLSTLTNQDAEKLAMINMIIQQLRDLEETKIRIDALHKKLEYGIEKLDTSIHAITKDNLDYHDRIHDLIKKEASEVKDDAIYRLQAENNKDHFIEINVDDIISDIADSKLRKIMNNENDINVDHSSMVDRYISKKHAEYAIENRLGNLNHAANIADFQAAHSHTISSIKSRVAVVMDKATSQSEYRLLMENIKSNNLKLNILREKRDQLHREKENLTTLSSMIDIAKTNSVGRTQAQSKLKLSELNHKTLSQIRSESSVLDDTKKINAQLDKVDKELDFSDISAYVADSTTKTAPSKPTSSYEKLMSALDVKSIKLKQMPDAKQHENDDVLEYKSPVVKSDTADKNDCSPHCGPRNR